MGAPVFAGSDGGGLLFEGGGEFFPLGGERGALGAEGFQLGGGALRVFGGGVVAEALFGSRDAGVNGGEFLLDGGDAVFELFQLDGVESLDGSGGLWRFGRNAGVLPLHFVQGQDDSVRG